MITYEGIGRKEVLYGQSMDEAPTFFSIARYKPPDDDWGPWYLFENTELGDELFLGSSFSGYTTIDEAKQALETLLEEINAR